MRAIPSMAPRRSSGYPTKDQSAPTLSGILTTRADWEPALRAIEAEPYAACLTLDTDPAVVQIQDAFDDGSANP